jgi:hypothetical protein
MLVSTMLPILNASPMAALLSAAGIVPAITSST